MNLFRPRQRVQKNRGAKGSPVDGANLKAAGAGISSLTPPIIAPPVNDHLKVGARLKIFSPHLAVGNSQSLDQQVNQGGLLHRVRLSSSSSIRTYQSSSQPVIFYPLGVQVLVRLGAVLPIPVNEQSKGHYSRLFLVKKKTTGNSGHNKSQTLKQAGDSKWKL